VIVIRFAWVMSYNTVVRWRIRRVGFHPPRPMMAPTVSGGLIVSWCGMRGIVTLVAALALPPMARELALAQLQLATSCDCVR
jgi:CPA1 family monovalent cation:H+ antiporter